MSRLKKVLQNIDLEQFNEGRANFKNPKPEIEYKAGIRVKRMQKCAHFKKEPIPFLRVKDVRIPEASGMMCDNCGCIASYKIRQNESKCECWSEEG